MSQTRDSRAMTYAAEVVATWQAQRQILKELEQAEHPDIVDHHGRPWVWRFSDIYAHDGMAWPEEWVLDGTHDLPGQAVQNNPNYQLCAICGSKADS